MGKSGHGAQLITVMNRDTSTQHARQCGGGTQSGLKELGWSNGRLSRRNWNSVSVTDVLP